MNKNFYLIIVLTFSVLFVKANNQSVIWSETFEGDWNANWHADAGTWEAGIPTSGPNAAHASYKCAATVLGGNYTEPVTSRLIRHTSFTVPTTSENPRLRFWHWYSFSLADYGKVQIKVDGTSDWVDISTSYTNTGSNIWSYPSIDLSDFAGQTVQIAFYFYSKDYTGNGEHDVSTGWYIDDIEIITGDITFNNPENWENGIGEWVSEIGTWEVGAPSGGPGSAHNGVHCAATVLAGSYAEPVSSKLISPVYTIPDATQNPRLRFWHWYSFSLADYGKVQIKVDGTSDWVDISTSYTNTGSNIWSYPSIDLSDYAGQTVQIAFYFYSKDYTGNGEHDVSTGWYIDDIEIITGDITFNNPENWENGISEWACEIGTWEVGAPSSGPGSAHNGVHCAATVLAGSYAEPVSSKLISPVYTVPDASQNPRLRFWHWYSFSLADYGKVQIKLDGTSDWVDVPAAYFTNTSGNIWTYTYFSLSEYAGQTVQIAFYFNSTDFTGNGAHDVSTGWYIDDVIIEGDKTKSNKTDISTFNFATPPQTGVSTINATAKTIELEVAYGTDLTNLIATFTLSDGATAKIGGIYQESGVTANDFLSPVIYSIIAEDGITAQDWIVTVTVAPNTETEILDFMFDTPPQKGDASIDATKQTINIEVFGQTDVRNLISTFTLSDGATIKVGGVVQESGVTANDFSSPVTYTVTADDGTTIEDWIVNVTIPTGIDEYLLRNINIYPNPFSDKTTIEFSNSSHSSYKLSVFSITGNKVYEMDNINTDKFVLNRGKLKTGIYIVELRGEKVFENKRIIIK